MIEGITRAPTLEQTQDTSKLLDRQQLKYPQTQGLKQAFRSGSYNPVFSSIKKSWVGQTGGRPLALGLILRGRQFRFVLGEVIRVSL